MNVLLMAAEVAPFAKVGGLADVAGSLPKALHALGHDVRVVMPCYKMVEDDPRWQLEEVLPPFPVPSRPGINEYAYVKRALIPAISVHSDKGSIPVYMIGSVGAAAAHDSVETPGYFQQATSSGRLYALEPEPYIFFCRAVLEMLTRLESEFVPDIIHCNDWHTALVPVYKHLFYQETPLRRTATLFTIHNVAYQGNFDRSMWAQAGLPNELLGMYGLEFYGRWTFMKGSLLFGDQVNTVSPTYAREIQTPDYGCGLDGLLRGLAAEGRLTGIVNGIDYEAQNPATDPSLGAHFSVSDLGGKAVCKQALQQELNLPQNDAMLIGMVSRLTDQKGLDLLHQAAPWLLAERVQLVVLGMGDVYYEQYMQELERSYPTQVRARIAFDAALAARIYAGSDLFLMPSRFEPCGLGQMIAMRYGSLPLVRATGGLADTVRDYDPQVRPEGYGFVFEEYSAAALIATIERALAAYRETDTRLAVRRRAMSADCSWATSARAYVALYQQAQSQPRFPG